MKISWCKIQVRFGCMTVTSQDKVWGRVKNSQSNKAMKSRKAMQWKQSNSKYKLQVNPKQSNCCVQCKWCVGQDLDCRQATPRMQWLYPDWALWANRQTGPCMKSMGISCQTTGFTKTPNSGVHWIGLGLTANGNCNGMGCASR